MSADPTTTTIDEHMNEQLINCLNLQTNVIRTLGQYSQNICFQLIDIKNNVEILSHRVMTLEQQSQIFSHIQMHIPPFPPSNPLLFSLAPTTYEQPSRDVPFIFNPIISTTNNYLNKENQSSVSNESFVHLSNDEENENILFNEYVKLYYFDFLNNQMKEHTNGQIEILQNKMTNTYRILMKNNQLNKIYINSNITLENELKIYHEMKYSYLLPIIDQQSHINIFCLQFKTDEHGKKFFKIFNQLKDDLLLLENLSLNDDDVIHIGEIQPTAEQIERARKLYLPSTFYLYENKPPCQGCRGCREGSSLFPSDEIQFRNQLKSSEFSAFSSGFSPNTSLPSLMSLVPNWFPDGVDTFPTFNVPSPSKNYRMIIKAKRSLPSNRLPPQSKPTSNYQAPVVDVDIEEEIGANKTHQKKSRNFSGYNTESNSLTDSASKMAQNILVLVKEDLYKLLTESQTSTTNNNKISTLQDDTKPSTVPNRNSTQSIFDKTSSVKNTSSDSILSSLASTKSLNNTIKSPIGFQFSIPTTTTNTTATFVFGNKSNISFSDVTNKAKGFQFPTNNEDDERVFPGHGALVFGKKTTATGTNDDDDDDNNNDNNNDDDTYGSTSQYKPIVNLLPVEVKTGEEDENILFNERAKLYRFDPSAKQMKERGVGPMKILQHKTTNYCRVLMRRDQVYKICANHRIATEMELKPHKDKENAFMWSAMDYSDGQLKHETLCVKFKKDDQAQRFFQQFNDAKQINANIEK